jgi:hypothetical protein
MNAVKSYRYYGGANTYSWMLMIFILCIIILLKIKEFLWIKLDMYEIYIFYYILNKLENAVYKLEMNKSEFKFKNKNI